MLQYFFGIYLLSIIPGSSSDICSTCLCSVAGNGPIIDCHNQDLGDNDMLNFDLLMLNEHRTLYELILSRNNIIQLPGQLLRKLKLLRSLDLSENLMETIQTGVYSDLKRLEDLNFSRNLLKSFDDSILSALPALLRLNLSHNCIETLEHVSSVSMENRIASLDLSRNNISNLFGDFFASLRNLENLDLSFNRIETIPEDVLANLVSLRTLSIDNNLIKSLSFKAFPESLRELRAGFNSIEEILYASSSIRVLNLEQNRLTKLEKNLTMLRDLLRLNISGNHLFDFPGIEFDRLEALDVSFNKFSNIPDTLSTLNFPALIELIVTGNPIRVLSFRSSLKLRSFVASRLSYLETIHEESFVKLKEPTGDCVDLTLSNNEKLKFIHEKSLQHMNVCLLDLSNNQIAYLPPSLIDLNANFETYSIDLQGNPLNCNCSLQWMLSDLVPKLYSTRPNLLDNLRCALPLQISNVRLVHWYGWKGRVFCENPSDHLQRMTMEVADVSSSKMIKFVSSPGLIVVVGIAMAGLTILVLIGILLARKQSMKRTRVNRRF